ncbi:MAG: Fe-Mn family superoxide dismutase [Myxococcota bacterium]|jgi:Fe-Mn family superoxide dismutase
MAFELPALPYAQDALSPHISSETLSIHHGKHHAGYIKKLNVAVEADSSLQGKSLEDIITSVKGGVFNNAAQVWNHTFYWNSMSPNGGGAPTGAIAAKIDATFGSFEAFKTQFAAAAGGQFGSGWAWLVQTSDGGLEITTTGNAATPLTTAHTALLTCDVWEHAYYVDYRNARPAYVQAWFNLVNWEFANANLK